MKSKEELEVLKTELECLRKKLSELTKEELEQINGGVEIGNPAPCPCGLGYVNVTHGHFKCWVNECGYVSKVDGKQFCNWYMQNIPPEF